MKINYKVGNFSAGFEGDTQRDLFEQIATFQEVFAEEECGKCKSFNLRYVVREVDDNQYYEIRCKDCGAKLSFGCHKKGGGLFQKKKDKDGNWLPDGGWVKYNKETGKEQ